MASFKRFLLLSTTNLNDKRFALIETTFGTTCVDVKIQEEIIEAETTVDGAVAMGVPWATVRIVHPVVSLRTYLVWINVLTIFFKMI